MTSSQAVYVQCKMMNSRCDLPRMAQGFAHEQAQLECVLPRDWVGMQLVKLASLWLPWLEHPASES